MVMLANTISPMLVTVPGFGLLGLHVAFTLSMLAAFIERPFVTQAGVVRFALCASLRANFISTLVGLLCTPVAILLLALPPLILVWWPVAIWVSHRVEYRCYDNAFLTGGATARRAPVLWGNLVSNLVILVVVILTPHPSASRIQWLHSLEPWLTISMAVVCAAVYFGAFWVLASQREDSCHPQAPARAGGADAGCVPAAPVHGVLH
jgi:hypothetical protein